MAAITVSATQPCWVANMYFTGERILFRDGIINNALLAELQASPLLIVEVGTPVKPTPVKPTHVKATPVNATPANAAPANATPANAAPVNAAPVTPAPVA